MIFNAPKWIFWGMKVVGGAKMGQFWSIMMSYVSKLRRHVSKCINAF
jgi:hypothetical protein